MDMSDGLVPRLLVSSLPRTAVDRISEALNAGAYRAYQEAKGRAEGHLPSILGFARHFWMNEAFYDALVTSGLEPSGLAGNRIVTCVSGAVTVARFNTKEAQLEKGRRSKARLNLAKANRILESIVQPGLFGSGRISPTEVSAFFVASFAAAPYLQPERPLKIEVAVPDGDMQKWLFCESIEHFMGRYEIPVSQEDRVRPRLKHTAQDIGRKPDVS